MFLQALAHSDPRVGEIPIGSYKNVIPIGFLNLIPWTVSSLGKEDIVGQVSHLNVTDGLFFSPSFRKDEERRPRHKRLVDTRDVHGFSVSQEASKSAILR
jgi:hypothetical protein